MVEDLFTVRETSVYIFTTTTIYVNYNIIAIIYSGVSVSQVDFI